MYFFLHYEKVITSYYQSSIKNMKTNWRVKAEPQPECDQTDINVGFNITNQPYHEKSFIHVYANKNGHRKV